MLNIETDNAFAEPHREIIYNRFKDAFPTQLLAITDERDSKNFLLNDFYRAKKAVDLVNELIEDGFWSAFKSIVMCNFCPLQEGECILRIIAGEEKDLFTGCPLICQVNVIFRCNCPYSSFRLVDFLSAAVKRFEPLPDKGSLVMDWVEKEMAAIEREREKRKARFVALRRQETVSAALEELKLATKNKEDKDNERCK